MATLPPISQSCENCPTLELYLQMVVKIRNNKRLLCTHSLPAVLRAADFYLAALIAEKIDFNCKFSKKESARKRCPQKPTHFVSVRSWFNFDNRFSLTLIADAISVSVCVHRAWVVILLNFERKLTAIHLRWDWMTPVGWRKLVRQVKIDYCETLYGGVSTP